MDSPVCARPTGSRHSLPILRRVKGTPIIEASSQLLGGSTSVQRPTRSRLAAQTEGDSQKERKHVLCQKSEKDLFAIARHAIPSVEDVTKKQRVLDSSQAPSLPSPPLKQSTPPSKYSAIDELAPVTVSSFLKVKAELDATKKVAHDYKRYIRKQEKQIEQMKEEMERLQKLQVESDASAQQTSRKTEELVTAVESHVQCQICMETLNSPYYLKCGHMYCLSCLQQWFRNMPRRDSDEDSDSDGLEGDEYIMVHPKSCPTCRAAVHERPAPIFMIKGIIGALDAYKGTTSAQSAELPSTEDPWRGIFYPPEDPATSRRGGNHMTDLLQFRLAFSDEEDQYEEAEEGFDEDDDRDTWASSVFGGYGSEEEFFDPVDEEYVLAQYEPPRLSQGATYGMLYYDEDLEMLNRGCTLGMMQKYHMSYSDEEGLLAIVHGGTQIYLGWNITLDPEDGDGSEMLNSIMLEVLSGSPKWEVTSWSSEDSGLVARRRVLVSELDRYQDSPYPEGDDSSDDDIAASVRVHEISTSTHMTRSYRF